MLAKLIRRIKCCSVQEILMIVSIIMLLIVIAKPNLGRDKSQIGVFGTDYTTPKTGCPTAGVIDTIFFRKVVPTGGNRQNFRHDFQLLPQPFFG